VEEEVNVIASQSNQQQKISERAYALWQREGCPHGRDMDHWLKAEREVSAENGKATTPVKKAEGNGSGNGAAARKSQSAAPAKPRSRQPAEESGAPSSSQPKRRK
jgi:hypothetical protein